MNLRDLELLTEEWDKQTQAGSGVYQLDLGNTRFSLDAIIEAITMLPKQYIINIGDYKLYLSPKTTELFELEYKRRIEESEEKLDSDDTNLTPFNIPIQILSYIRETWQDSNNGTTFAWLTKPENFIIGEDGILNASVINPDEIVKIINISLNPDRDTYSVA